MASRRRQRWWTFLRLAACAGALWIVLWNVTWFDRIHTTSGELLVGSVVEVDGIVQITLRDGTRRAIDLHEVSRTDDGRLAMEHGLHSVWQNSRKGLFLLAFVLYFPVILPQAWRFQWMLRAQDIHLPFRDVLKLSFAGNFLNFATPLGSNAGDVFKAYFLSLHTSRRTEAVATVVLDRVVGLVSLLLVVVVLTAMSGANSPLSPLRPYLFTLLGVTVIGGLLYFSPAIRRVIVPRVMMSHLPFVDQLRRMDAAAHALAQARGIVILTVALTIFLQAVAIGGYVVVAVALGLRVAGGDVPEYYAYFYTGLVVQALPGPPQGLGTVELAYLYFFKSFGSPSQIVSVALAVRGLTLVCALPGLLVTMTGAYRPAPGWSGSLMEDRPDSVCNSRRADVSHVEGESKTISP